MEIDFEKLEAAYLQVIADHPGVFGKQDKTALHLAVWNLHGESFDAVSPGSFKLKYFSKLPREAKDRIYNALSTQAEQGQVRLPEHSAAREARPSPRLPIATLVRAFESNASAAEIAIGLGLTLAQLSRFYETPEVSRAWHAAHGGKSVPPAIQALRHVKTEREQIREWGRLWRLSHPEVVASPGAVTNLTAPEAVRVETTFVRGGSPKVKRAPK